MIERFDVFSKFKERLQKLGVSGDLSMLEDLKIIFYEVYDKYVIINIPGFNGKANHVLYLSKDANLTYPAKLKTKARLKLSKIKGKKDIESTLLAYEVFNTTLENYYSKYRLLAEKIEDLHDDPNIDIVEDVAKRIRTTSDIVEDLLKLFLEIEDGEIDFINPKIIPYEFDLLVARTNHLVDRIRNLKKEINILRTKCEMVETKTLSKRIELLTKVMAVLTIVGVIISVPNTLATVFGVKSIADLFTIENMFWIMVWGTIVSVVASLIYMKMYLKKVF
ncbi:hypothetical protein KAW38_00180 [Candidatus Micrarchaeota archaeon]|nr:hypothetical protein [Candidatus Micrarchaeota archaeon]